MHPAIRLSVEGPRGCGYRKKGGAYLVSDNGRWSGCGKLPIELVRCPTCDCGIKPCLGWTWVNGRQLLPALGPCGAGPCDRCPFGGRAESRVGLIWCGQKFYPTPQDFLDEARALGVSRRLKAVPRDFVLGETWIWMAHAEAVPCPDGTALPGVFFAYRPQRVEVVVDGTESDAEIEALLDRGLSPVKVERRANWAHRGVEL